MSYGQNDFLTEEQYYLGFPFQEGIYLSFNEFKTNQPSYQRYFEKRGSNLYLESDSSKEMILIDPRKVWGYSKAGNIYISQEDAYWRIINIGALSQFTSIILKSFRTVDNFGFPIEHQTKSLEQLFLDFNSGELYELTAENLQPFVDREPLLANRFKKMKRMRARDLILVLKAYNELYPIYFPIHE